MTNKVDDEDFDVDFALDAGIEKSNKLAFNNYISQGRITLTQIITQLDEGLMKELVRECPGLSSAIARTQIIIFLQSRICVNIATKTTQSNNNSNAQKDRIVVLEEKLQELSVEVRTSQDRRRREGLVDPKKQSSVDGEKQPRNETS